MSIAFLFPGQGSQAVGMGQELADRFPVVQATLDTAERLVGLPIRRLCFEGPQEDLTQTQNAQLALLSVSVAFTRLLNEGNLQPAAAAGHSLGEYSALVAAGALSFEEALQLVALRGELMARAGVEQEGTMAAVLGFDASALAALCAVAPAVVAVANYNGPGQIIISGTPTGVQWVGEQARQQGAKRVLPLKVSGAFHSPLMAGAARAFAPALAQAAYALPRFPVYANVDAAPYEDAQSIPGKLAAQLESPVRWDDTIRRMVEMGVDKFVEVGPGRVLSGLARRLAPTAAIFNVEDSASFEAAMGALAQRAPR